MNRQSTILTDCVTHRTPAGKNVTMTYITKFTCFCVFTFARPEVQMVVIQKRKTQCDRQPVEEIVITCQYDHDHEQNLNHQTQCNVVDALKGTFHLNPSPLATEIKR